MTVQAQIQQKICGTCIKASFPLSPEDTNFLQEALNRFGAPALQRWTENGTLNFQRDFAKHKKTRATKILRDSWTYCQATGIRVHWADQRCFLWKPRPQNTP
jgi:hypothetical protein